jgi:membrane protein required for colicin V production
MNYFDILFIIPLLWGAYKGFTKGLIVSVASLLALLLGIYGAIRFSGLTRTWVSDTIDVQANYVPLIAFALTFVGIVVAIHFIAKLIHKLVEAIALGWLNTIAGILFGILKTTFILSIIIFVLEKVDHKGAFIPNETKEKSLLYRPIQIIAPSIFPSLKAFELEDKLPSSSITQYEI